jgi:hypothetical protein
MKYDTTEQKIHLIHKLHDFYMLCADLFPYSKIHEVIKHSDIDNFKMNFDPEQKKEYELSKGQPYSCFVATVISCCKKMTRGVTDREMLNLTQIIYNVMIYEMAKKINVNPRVIHGWFTTLKNPEDELNMKKIKNDIEPDTDIKK